MSNVPQLTVSLDPWVGLAYWADDGWAGEPTVSELVALGVSRETLELVGMYEHACSEQASYVMEWVEKRPDIDPDVTMDRSEWPGFEALRDRLATALARDCAERAVILD